MQTENKQIDTANVSNKIFETFLEELKKDGISEEIINRLRDLIINKSQFSDKEISAALFFE